MFYSVSRLRRNTLLIAAMLGGTAIYVAIGFVVGSWFWVGGTGVLIAFLGWAGDSLIRAQRKTTRSREPIRLPPIPPAAPHGPWDQR
jgi:hypothetical protein